jgi:hypothetical protein
MQAKVLTKDEARRIAVNVARLPGVAGKGRSRHLTSPGRIGVSDQRGLCVWRRLLVGLASDPAGPC